MNCTRDGGEGRGRGKGRLEMSRRMGSGRRALWKEGGCGAKQFRRVGNLALKVLLEPPSVARSVELDSPDEEITREINLMCEVSVRGRGEEGRGKVSFPTSSFADFSPPALPPSRTGLVAASV